MILKTNYYQMLSLQMAHIHEKILLQNEEYQHINEECEACFQSIVEPSLHPRSLDELTAALIQYSDRMTDLRSLAESTMYEQGIKDGYAIQQWLVSTNAKGRSMTMGGTHHEAGASHLHHL